MIWPFKRETRTASLYDLSRDLAAARERRAAYLSLMKHAREAFQVLGDA